MIERCENRLAPQLTTLTSEGKLSRWSGIQQVKRARYQILVMQSDLISDLLPFGRLWYGEPNAISNAIGYAKFYSRSHDAVIRVYDAAGNVIETHEHAREFKEC
jgi:hypothetical protein